MGEHRVGKERVGKRVQREEQRVVVGGSRRRESEERGEREREEEKVEVRCVIFRVSHLSLSSSSACCLESWSASFNCSSSSLGSVGRACSTFCSALRPSLSELWGGGEVHVWGRRGARVRVEERCMCGGGGEVHV